jgi:DNA-binding transcriptional LysR family regulator
MANTKWEGIEAFIHVVNLNSFSKAASHMGVSKSHISRQITQLENRLNAQLLIRTTRKVAVTEVGQAFYLRCNDVLTNLDDAEQAVIDLQEKPRGRLRVTVAVGFGEDFYRSRGSRFYGATP